MEPVGLEREQTILIYCRLYLIWPTVISIQSVKLSSDPWSFSPLIFLLQMEIMHLDENETCAENLKKFSILFNLNGEKERIEVHKGNIK